ncbi:putative lactosylceramide 4-alpha-galactosyltransferase [Helianthus annuus]|uniref:Lactosylceramide 4-alpha-galactosyltransferase n=1 Tax=Helianthus annuus TaxID=4232 RepID=A0A251SSL6_HELAN|nr:uncharacterized protein At4g19900 [Helianthus annuus]KAF5773731.1 putative lactosylceramide 4-alpha-galactosyltransferase [Helianthus annuus]KAJ0477184.1 putative lactosylceramide 4-alpha-galactosyltransferase [Helianthus annuus]KAJ0498019.1 putative lactosylceramide 4-alpha-galactosyltransferase [Helianthus annuus]KAJ0849556.1 putative lactosylceramide 4-alpha-galactosyltransferase [Helianthus annuus]KAJ0858581.1 putative lactosylceramide 4-alpha-galactosyltransferase [Helianthus annuus]
MIKLSSPSRVMQRRLSLGRHVGTRIFSIISLAAIFFTYMFTTQTLTSNLSTHVLHNQTLIVQHVRLTTFSIHKPKEIPQETILQDDHKPFYRPINHIIKEMINKSNENLPEFDILKSTTLTRRFKQRAHEFFKEGCKVRFFMTWISPSMRVFGEREFIALDALFKSNTNSCLMILSNTMDSSYGFQILKPVTDRGYHVQAITPDLEFLFKNTPAQSWLDHIKNGKRNPGKIPLAQNLSNLIRLAVLYKYGGVYIDTDFIILKDFSGLRNSIGAQSASRSGNWTRLNNAVLVFDKNHKLLYKFMEEFAATFDGNKWGHNGPYLVSRVVEREAAKLELNFTVLPPKAFYPVDWTRVGGFFTTPVNQVNRRWVEAKVDQLNRLSYGVHLWNKQSCKLRIEEGSIMARLFLNYCVICNVK